jgi:hypothetical protein
MNFFSMPFKLFLDPECPLTIGAFEGPVMVLYMRPILDHSILVSNANKDIHLPKLWFAIKGFWALVTFKLAVSIGRLGLFR